MSSSVILDGKAVSANLHEAIKTQCAALKSSGIIPGLAVILVGDDPASATYVANKEKACVQLGFYSEMHHLPAETNENELLKLINKLNVSDKIHGILVQLPLPMGFDQKKVLDAISVNKDVDAFSPVNIGKIIIGDYDFLPCTPAGIMEILRYYKINTDGKSCVVVGRSNIVGKPMAMLLLHANATVTICHSKTVDLSSVTSQADILIAAVGKPNFITGRMVKHGAVVIDVGMNRDENGKLCGDVDFKSVSPKASHITPVPGGVGPMTITMLMKNTLKAAELKMSSK